MEAELRQLPGVVLLCWAIFASHFLVPCAVAGELVLTNAAQVRSLSPAQAQEHWPARLSGVVVSEAEAGGDGIVLLDSTAGIFISGPYSLLSQLHRGDSVEVDGVCDPGEFAPLLLLKNFRQIGQRKVPAPHRATFDEVISGSQDAQWVEISGVVRSAEPVPWGVRRWKFDLGTGGGRLAVVVISSNSPERFVDAEVRLRGICFYQVNQNRQVIQPELFVPHEILVQVETPAPPDPFSAPIYPIGSLLQFTPQGSYGHRRHVQGIVTACQPGKQLWVQDEAGGIRAFIRQTNSLAPGDLVDLVGFPIRGDYSPVLEDAVFQKKEPGPEPRPTSLGSPAEALTKDACLIRLNASLTGIQPSMDGCVLLLTEGGESFKALLTRVERPVKLPAKWQVGSRVAVTGICSVTAAEGNSPASGLSRPTAFQILLRSAEDVAIIRPAPWLNSERAVWLLGATSLALLVIILAVFLVARRRLREQALHRELAEAELAAILKERNRLAREIHDTLAQGLTAISMQIELVKDKFAKDASSAGKHLDQARALVRTSLADARGAIWNMRAQVLEEGDLAEALSGVLQQLAGGTSIKCHFQQTGPVRRLAPQVENDLLRIGQEAITNAIRHARPQEVLVQLEFDARRLKMLVRDDGVGFDVSHPPKSESGFGLLGMRERIQQLGGEFSLRSRPGEGTEFSIELPVPE